MRIVSVVECMNLAGSTHGFVHRLFKTEITITSNTIQDAEYELRYCNKGVRATTAPMIPLKKIILTYKSGILFDCPPAGPYLRLPQQFCSEPAVRVDGDHTPTEQKDVVR